jgi:hypothetical protein
MEGGGWIEAAWFPDNGGASATAAAGGTSVSATGGDVRVVAVREYGAAGVLQSVSFATERRVGPGTASPAGAPAAAVPRLVPDVFGDGPGD